MLISGHTDSSSRYSPAKRRVEECAGENNSNKKKLAGPATTTPVPSKSNESKRGTVSDEYSNSKRYGTSKEPKKRGRPPKGPKINSEVQPHVKRGKEKPAKRTRGPYRKPPIAVLRKTGEVFLQDGPCFKVAPKLDKCRECDWTLCQRSKTQPDLFCRFYGFRQLKYTSNGELTIAGFPEPHVDPSVVS